MVKEKLDFNQIIDRRNTDCLKYDFAVRRGKPEHVLPLWIADMDFKTSPEILDAMQKRIVHGVFGYSESNDDYVEAIDEWMRYHHQWHIKKEWLVKTPGVVFALAMAVKAYTKEGEAVLIQQPVYYPFADVITNNHRKVISNDLVLGADRKYHIDFEDFEHKIVEHHIRLFFLCNPHNPVGRVWTKEELIELGNICLKHQVIVVADEIHEDFVFGQHRHCVFASICEAFRDISISCTSPAKTFNLPGLQISNIFIPNKKLKMELKREIASAGYSQVNVLGITACEAAYRYGQDWYEELMKYLEENLIYLRKYIRKEIPQIHMIEPEGTYLVWLDFRKLGLSDKELEKFIVDKANLWLDQGYIFGKSGEGFERINIGCSRIILKKALQQLKLAVDELL